MHFILDIGIRRLCYTDENVMWRNEEAKTKSPGLIYKKNITKQKPHYSLSINIESGMKILETDT